MPALGPEGRRLEGNEAGAGQAVLTAKVVVAAQEAATEASGRAMCEKHCWRSCTVETSSLPPFQQSLFASFL